MSETFKEALRLHGLGLSVIPVAYRGKKPALDWKEYQTRRPHPARVAEWFSSEERNIGIVTGEVSGLVVLDVDRPDRGLRDRVASLPTTPTVKTGKGWHYYFKHPGIPVRNRVNVLPGADIRGDGGFVVAPPSVHAHGLRYEWLTDISEPLASLPDWLREKIESAEISDRLDIALCREAPASTAYGEAALLEEYGTLMSAQSGARNSSLNIAACKLGNLVGAELDEDSVYNALVEASIVNGLVADDGIDSVIATIRSGLTRGMQTPRGVSDGPEIIVRPRADIPTVIFDTVVNNDEIPSMAIEGVASVLEEYNQQPSEEHWKGLRQIAKVMEGMACRLHEMPPAIVTSHFDQSFFVSFLSPGMGKTTVLIETVRAILEMEAHSHVSFIIFLSRLEEIKIAVERMGLDENAFAVLTSDEEYNALGNPNKKQARVLFTTQQMLERRSREARTFAEISDFHYQGKPRQVRVWDEAILPSRILTLERRRIMRLLDGLFRIDPAISNDIESFTDRLKSVSDGELTEFPGIEGYGVPLDEALLRFDGDDKEAIEALYCLQGRLVRVAKDQYGTVTLHYDDILPDDLAPMLILDASGQQRKTYELWARDRKGLKFLYSPQKAYKGLQIYHWDKGAGKQSQMNGQYKAIAEGVAKVINSLPGEECLIFHFKASKFMPDMEEEIKSRLDDPDKVSFCHWGRHTATNDYSEIKNIFLAGILQYNTAQYEATGIAAKKADISVPLTEQEFTEVRLGEIAHHILQAACRGNVRQTVDDNCPPGCRLFIAFSTQRPTGVPRELLQRIFPGAEIQDWRPVIWLKGKMKAVAEAIMTAGKKGRETVTREDLLRLSGASYKHLGSMLKHAELTAYLRAEGFEIKAGYGGKVAITRLVEDLPA